VTDLDLEGIAERGAAEDADDGAREKAEFVEAEGGGAGTGEDDGSVSGAEAVEGTGVEGSIHGAAGRAIETQYHAFLRPGAGDRKDKAAPGATASANRSCQFASPGR